VQAILNFPEMKLSPGQVYAMTLRKVHTFMLSRDFEASQLLSNTELHDSDLRDPYRVISAHQARLYYRNVAHLVGSQGMGLEIGWTTSLSEKGPQGLMQISSETVQSAMEEGRATFDTYNVLIDWNYHIEDGAIIHRISSDEEDESLRIFLIERALGMIQAHSEELVGSDVTPIKVLLDYGMPKDFSRYKEIFRCPLHFNEKLVELHYSEKYLSQNLKSYDPQAHDVLEALQETLLNKLATGSDLVTEVKMLLRGRQGQFPSLEQVASKLAMSSRNLRRKLGEKDVRFQDLLDDERRKLAEDYLLNSDMTIQQVSEHCGFNDSQNFTQAFRRWLGMSPMEFRNSRREK